MPHRRSDMLTLMLIDDCEVSHDITGVHREPPDRAMAADFRGDLNQIILAADVPVKCGTGLLQRFLVESCDRSCLLSAAPCEWDLRREP